MDGAKAIGRRAAYLPADLGHADAITEVFDFAHNALGPVTAVVVAHNYESTNGGLLETTPAEFDRSMAVNARATMLLAAEFARRFLGRKDEAAS